MIYRNQNYSRANIANVDFTTECDFIECNLSQETPNTVIDLHGMAHIFKNCNLVNCNFANSDKAIFTDCNRAQVDLTVITEPSSEPQPDIELAAYATAARAILAKSDKLKSPEIIAYLDSLEAKQKEAAGIDLPDGESATVLVRKMIESLTAKGENDKATELQQALDSVIQMTNGVL